MCSTTGWKEPICERFGFLVEDKWIQLDIPHSLMEKLELEKGTEILYPIYISKKTSEKELSFGGITLEKEDEIFIEKPLTEKNLEKELTRWLTERDELIQDNQEKQQTIVELEKSLEEERTNKKKIQEELDEFLNKLTNEKEIQTDLTAEQITQMEKDLEQQATKITELSKSRDELTNQINQLKEQAKESEANEDEKTLLDFLSNFEHQYIKGGILNFNREMLDALSDYFSTGKKPNSALFHNPYITQKETKFEFKDLDIGGLRDSYSKLCQSSLSLTRIAINRMFVENSRQDEIKKRNDLRTKYDLEVKTKAEIVKELTQEKDWWDKWMSDFKNNENYLDDKKDIGYHDRKLSLTTKKINEINNVIKAEGLDPYIVGLKEFNFFSDYDKNQISIFFTVDFIKNNGVSSFFSTGNAERIVKMLKIFCEHYKKQ